MNLIKAIFKKYVRYPLEFLGVVILWGVFRILPMHWASTFVGKALVFLMPLMMITTATRQRIQKIFPELSAEQCHRIARQAFENFGRTVGEMIHLDHMDLRDTKRFECVGIEHLDAAISTKKPTIFVSAHYGNWEILSLYAGFRGGVARQIYRPPNNPLVDRFLRRLRKPINPDPIPKGRTSLRESIKALQQGHLLCLLIDQKLYEGLEIPFLGYPAPTTTLPALLAYRLQADIVTARCIRKSNHCFKIVIDSPIQADQGLSPAEGVVKLTTQLNQIIESWIRDDPGQWFWLHKRWKNFES